MFVCVSNTHVNTYGIRCMHRLCKNLIKIRFLCVYQVLIRGQLSADSEASGVLAIDDLSFSPGCVTLPGTAASNISLHRRDKFRPWHFWNIATHKQTTTNLFWILISKEEDIKAPRMRVIKIVLTTRFFSEYGVQLVPRSTRVMSATVCCLQVSDEYCTAQHFSWERLIKHHPFGILDRIFTCCLGDIHVFQPQTQTIASLQPLWFIQYGMMLPLSVCLYGLFLIGLQPVAFSFFRSLSSVETKLLWRQN